MSDPDCAFNNCCKKVTLTIEKRDGSTHVIDSGKVKLVAGSNIAISEGLVEDEIQIAVDQENIIEGYYDKKFQDLASVTEANDDNNPISGDDVGDNPPYCFSRRSMYLATINGIHVNTLSGSFFILASNCTSVGEFEGTPGYAQQPDLTEPPEATPDLCGTLGPPEPSGGDIVSYISSLSILDICTPCLDCLQFQQIYAYMERIERFFTYMEDIANVASEYDTVVGVPHPDGGYREDFYGTLQQHRAQSELFDYFVHQNSLVLRVVGQGQSITVSACYRNVGNQALFGLDFDFTLTFFEGSQVWQAATDVFELKAMGRDGFNDLRFVQSDTTSPGIMVVSFSDSGIIGVGEYFSADFALLLKETPETYKPGENYNLQAVLSATGTHLSGPPPEDFPVERERRVTFVPGRGVSVKPAPSSSSSSEGP